MLSLNISDHMDALDAVRPLMFSDIAVCAIERLLAVYCRHVWFEVV